MRLISLLLVLANVAFYAWAQYSPQAASPESHLVEQQIQPDSIRLLSPQQVALLAAAGPSPKPETSGLTACMEWGAFNAADVQRAQAALKQVAPPARVAERRVEEAAGWWVFMPPTPTRQAVMQKLEELKRLGIEDYFVVQDDPKLRFAISLGVFRTEEAAKTRLDQLRGRGVKTAQQGRRKTPVQKVYLQLHDFPEAMRSKLAELKEGFPATELRECTMEPVKTGGAEVRNPG